MDLTVSIVNYNTADLLERCLASLGPACRGLSYETIIVDNASADDSIARVRAKFPEVKIIQNNENRFFSRAHNQALRMAQGRYCLILNPDCYFKEDEAGLKVLVDFMDRHPEAAAAGPKVLKADEKTPQGSGDRLPTLAYGLFEVLLLNTLWPGNPVWRWRARPEWDRNNTESVDMIGGACMLVRSSSFERVGLFDEKLLIYWSETDWCKRMLDCGHSLYFVPDVRIYHFGSAGMDLHGKERKERISFEGMLYYYRKHFGLGVQGLLWLILNLFTFPVLKAVRWLRSLSKHEKEPIRS